MGLKSDLGLTLARGPDLELLGKGALVLVIGR